VDEGVAGFGGAGRRRALEGAGGRSGRQVGGSVPQRAGAAAEPGRPLAAHQQRAVSAGPGPTACRGRVLHGVWQAAQASQVCGMEG
jgi:hypothetical protein